MILAWLLLLILATVLVRQNRASGVTRPKGSSRAWWFTLWAVAGFFTSISLATGLSIGILILPAAAAALLWAARRAPYLPEAAGFAVGIGVTAALIASLTS